MDLVRNSTEPPESKHPGGRPPLWKSPRQLEAKIEKYRKKCDEESKPFTMSGLAVALGCDRKTLVNYSNKDEFLPTIKRARTYAEAWLESMLLSGKPPIGAIFVAKNNFGWKDKSEIEVEQKFMMIDILRVLEENSADGTSIEGEVVANREKEISTQ
jgi:hypothetical protein